MRREIRENLRSMGYNTQQICEIKEVYKSFRGEKCKISYFQAAALYKAYGLGIGDAVGDYRLLMKKMCEDRGSITTGEIVDTLVEAKGEGIDKLIWEKKREDPYAYYEMALTFNM